MRSKQYFSRTKNNPHEKSTEPELALSRHIRAKEKEIITYAITSFILSWLVKIMLQQEVQKHSFCLHDLS